MRKFIVNMLLLNITICNLSRYFRLENTGYTIFNLDKSAFQ